MAIKFLASGQEKASNLQNKQVKEIFQPKKRHVRFCFVVYFVLFLLFCFWFGFFVCFGVCRVCVWLVGWLVLAAHFFPCQVGRQLTWLLSVKAVLFAAHSDTLVSSNKSSRQRAASLKSQRKPFQ